MEIILDNMEQPKNNNSLIILLSILLFISLVIAGFFAYQVQNLTEEIKKLEIEELAAQISSPTLDSTANWNVYMDSGGLFSFKYPNNFSIQVTDDPELIVLTGYSGDNVEEIYIDWRKKEFSNITVDEYIKKMERTDIINSKIETSLGLDMVVVTHGKLGGQFGVSKGEDRVFIIYSRGNRLIKLTTSVSTNTFEKFDQILSTFKFLDEGIALPISVEELNKGWYWGDINQKKTNTPSDWVFSDAGRSSCWHKVGVNCI
jgi:hypothetical protein